MCKKFSEYKKQISEAECKADLEEILEQLDMDDSQNNFMEGDNWVELTYLLRVKDDELFF